MTQIASPFAIPCIRFNGLCPTFYFKRPVTKKIIPNRNENPILQDKRFIEAKQNDLKNDQMNQSVNDENNNIKNNDANEQKSFVTETPTETQIHFE